MGDNKMAKVSNVKISKVDAFQHVTDAVDRGDYKTANEIMSIITRSINKDKQNNAFSEEIDLKTNEVKLFPQKR